MSPHLTAYGRSSATGKVCRPMFSLMPINAAAADSNIGASLNRSPRTVKFEVLKPSAKNQIAPDHASNSEKKSCSMYTLDDRRPRPRRQNRALQYLLPPTHAGCHRARIIYCVVNENSVTAVQTAEQTDLIVTTGSAVIYK